MLCTSVCVIKAVNCPHQHPVSADRAQNSFPVTELNGAPQTGVVPLEAQGRRPRTNLMAEPDAGLALGGAPLLQPGLLRTCLRLCRALLQPVQVGDVLSPRRVRNSLVQPEGGCPQVVHLVVGFLATAKPASFSRPAGLSRMQLAW